jgi:hypothetical protein
MSRSDLDLGKYTFKIVQDDSKQRRQSECRWIRCAEKKSLAAYLPYQSGALGLKLFSCLLSPPKML